MLQARNASFSVITAKPANILSFDRVRVRKKVDSWNTSSAILVCLFSATWRLAFRAVSWNDDPLCFANVSYMQNQLLRREICGRSGSTRSRLVPVNRNAKMQADLTTAFACPIGSETGTSLTSFSMASQSQLQRNCGSLALKCGKKARISRHSYTNRTRERPPLKTWFLCSQRSRFKASE
jgi:hypothetical protein